ncbi:MAG TPA: hypothetical protein VG103_04925 [Chthoniobacterales bacterium]|nr:hypothetical protein [Chthoniobacterales bacterium]
MPEPGNPSVRIAIQTCWLGEDAGVAVGIGVRAGVAIGVIVGVALGVAVGIGVGVGVGPQALRQGVPLGVGVAVDMGVALGLGVGVGVGLVAIGVIVGVAVGIGVGVGVTVGAGVGVGPQPLRQGVPLAIGDVAVDIPPERPWARAAVDSLALGPSAGFIRVVSHEARVKASNANTTLETSKGNFNRQSEYIILEQTFTERCI